MLRDCLKQVNEVSGRALYNQHPSTEDDGPQGRGYKPGSEPREH
jgi:hypothetical protein